jgi:apolipoprotein N-acyltransferase
VTREAGGPGAAGTGVFPLAGPWAFAAAALSGILYWASFPGVELWPLALVAWVPLVVALHRQRAWRAALLGGTAGLTMNVAGHVWLMQMLQTFSGFPSALCFLFLVIICSYQGGRIGFQGWLYARGVERGWPREVTFAAAFVAAELLYPVLFPWYFSATMHRVPVLSQLGDVGGPILVGLVVVAPNVALGEIAIALLERRRWPLRTAIVAGAVLAVALVYGAVRVRSVDAATAAAPGATVGVVQANMGLFEKRQRFDEGIRRHLRLSEEARRQGADFLVWSETSAMHAVRDESYRAELQTLGKRIGLPAIFGSVIIKPVPDEREYVLYNSAVSTDGEGFVSGRYDKEYLLTFGEYLPFGEEFPILYKWSPNSGHFTPGTSLEPLVLPVHGDAHPVTALICYEDILPRFTNAAVRHGRPDLMVNLTNDAWFGDTAEPWEHLALAQMRSIEHRRYLVRGTNSGVSAVIDPVGRVIAHSGTFREETVVAPIHWMHGWTAYELWGDWPWLIVSLGALAAAFVRRPLRASSPS